MVPDWLGDLNSPLVIEGPIWRQRVVEIEDLPRWSREPTEDVRRYFELVRKKGTIPSDVPEDLAQAVAAHFKADLVAFMWHGTSIRDRDTRRRIVPHWQPGQTASPWCSSRAPLQAQLV